MDFISHEGASLVGPKRASADRDFDSGKAERAKRAVELDQKIWDAVERIPTDEMNSREKGKRGERAWRDELRAQGFDARRGQQFSGSPDSPDVVCPAVPWVHFEVKCVERLNIEDAMAQARRDAWTPHPGPLASAEREKIPVVAHKRNFCGWLVTMDAETFFRFLRGTLPPESSETETKNSEQKHNS